MKTEISKRKEVISITIVHDNWNNNNKKVSEKYKMISNNIVASVNDKNFQKQLGQNSKW